MRPPTSTLLGDSVDTPAPIELRLRHARGADRDQWRGKEKADQQTAHGTASFGVTPLPVRQCGRRHRAPAAARVLQATGGDDSLTVSAVGMSAVTNFGPP